MTKHQTMCLTVDIPSRQVSGHVHRAGSPGIIVEPLGPRAWLVEVRVPDESLAGDAWYETLEVLDTEFEVTETGERECIHIEQPFGGGDEDHPERTCLRCQAKSETESTESEVTETSQSATPEES